MSAEQNLNLLLDLYQQSRMKGEWASLSMETMEGKEFITFKMGNLPAGFKAGVSAPVKQSMKRKTPSQQRRDERRKNEYLAKKSQEATDVTLNAKNKKATKTVLLIEPKDEINLEEPEVEEASEKEKDVNIVGEYVYDTKLQKDEINNTFWKTIQENFQHGVDKFYDGSLWNEKIVFFWGKCKLKNGFNRSYILDSKNWPKELKYIKIEEPG
eukprot:GFUD01137298.1.p1 GENE.GFUD01137298.1~~GFUD01137298.1.p1  ORF type:complete len:212 (-),score=73.99 GFUD01137298.1:65-700(-)